MTQQQILRDCSTQHQQLTAKRFITKLAWLMAGGMFLDGFVLGYLGSLMPSITDDLNLNTTWQGLIGSATLIGIFFGAPIGGYLADRFGRKPLFKFDILLFLFCSIAQFFVSDPYTLFITRLIIGIAIGIEYAVSWPMLAEFAPARIRGKLLAATELGWYIGYLMSYALSYILVEQKIANWSIILGLSTIPSLILLIMRRGTPESPRWLMSKGRKQEAYEIANKYFNENDKQDILNQQHDSIDKSTNFFDIFKPKHIKATIFLTIYFVAMAGPYFAIGVFIPMVLEKLGMQDGMTGGLFLNMIAVFGAITAITLVERVSRRKMTIIPFLVCTIALIIVALAANHPTLIIINFLIYSFFSTMIACMISVIPSEILRPEVSSKGIGFAAAMSRVAAAIGVFLMPSFIASYGVVTAIWIAAGVSFLATFITYLYMPETKGKTITEIFH
ncbi:MFS transporter [Acinetobacter seifertii]|uniref:MFS transporter n=1 Tax=Acinetobacter seifertii TaxID=1530123 RepID=UPI00168BC299|nr:MFS transporter [Acinetobacter seifertii]QNX86606.1 MFS transporter [Acinetobacter seifertii]